MIQIILTTSGHTTEIHHLTDLPCTLLELYKECSKIFEIEINRIYIEDGTAVKNIDYIRKDDTLYAVPVGETFSTTTSVVENTSPHRIVKNTSMSDWIWLNVGGKRFLTSKSTLIMKAPNSMLARMFSLDGKDCICTPSETDSTGAYLIDRSPMYFEPILNFLRSGRLIYDINTNPEGLLEEANFFGIDSVIPILEQEITRRKHADNQDSKPLNRRDVVTALIHNSITTELRFQGVNLAGTDLSRLDLRYINFKYANMQNCTLTGANLSFCCLERADLKGANLDGAQLLGIRCLCANLEGASLKNCNFNDPAGSRANMESVNLKGANLEGSDMGSVNLRVATLKNANLQNCDLRAAVLAGADLESCNLTGSDLHEANLRGANLKNAVFELMLTPLHMSQTIR